MPNQQLVTTLRRLSRYLVIGLVGFGFLAIFTYIYNIVSSKPAIKESSAQQQTITNIEPTTTPILPTTTPILPTPTPEITDYRTILLLERAADLMLKYIDKVKAGEIDPRDASVRDPYLDAFPLAIDAYNHSGPTTGMEHGWKNVVMVAQAYSLVYPVLQQGRLVSNNDLFNMKWSRQWLTNYQNTEESVLSSKGFSNEFFTAEKEAVEKLLQESYSSTPVPPIEP